MPLPGTPMGDIFPLGGAIGMAQNKPFHICHLEEPPKHELLVISFRWPRYQLQKQSNVASLAALRQNLHMYAYLS